MPVVPVSSAGKRRGLGRRGEHQGSPCSSSGPLENGIMDGSTIIGLIPWDPSSWSIGEKLPDGGHASQPSFL